MPITKYLERNAEKWPNDTALVELNPTITVPKLTTWKEYELMQPGNMGPYRQEISWRIFDEKANRVANTLLSRGVEKGDKVGILLMNCLDWLPIYFGILKTGALAVPLNFRYDAEEIEYCVNLADVEVLFFGPEFIGRIEEIVDTLQQRRLLFYVGPACPTFAENFILESANASSVAPNIEIDDEDYAAIYFSSGTTGFPKAILHRHRALMHSAAVEQKHHGQTKDDVFLCIPPLYHTGAKMHWFGSLLTGGKAVLLRGTKPDIILRAISEEYCTIVWLLVPWAQDILDALDRGDLHTEDYRLDQWRLMHIGAQPVPPSLIRHWLEYFPHHQYDTNYGLSESLGPGCVHLGVDHIDKVGAIGVPGYGWEAKIVAEDHSEAAPGSVGELAVRGPTVMCGYYKNEEATAEVLGDDGWLYTGDMAKQDEDGFYYLVDRKKDVIISGGENIYPVQIEDFLHGYEPVKDVAVIGLPDKRLGEISAAIIELKEGYSCNERQINEYCNKLPRYKRPVRIIFAPVPRNATGKIEKPKLREQYGASFLVAAENEMR
ncbi:MAG: class I adenylate-forming enzyme family protein [Anaerovoracaceae bacterium]|jgi:long-chain acyl-CoA synthetase